MSKNEHGKGHGKLIVGVVIAVVVIVLAAGFGTLRSISKPLDKNSQEYVIVSIPQGTSTAGIGEIIEEKGIIKSANNFKIYSKIFGYSSKYQAGAYQFSPSMDMKTICEAIANGDTCNNVFTVPEGYTELDIADLLSELGYVDRDKFIDALQNHDFSAKFPFLKNAQSGKYKLEGYLFPATYSIDPNATEVEIIEAMLTRYSEVYTEDYRAKAKSLGYTDNQVMIVASLIERETKIDSDRAKVASVIYNRLKKDMPLQIDATVIYAFKLAGVNKTSLTYEDLGIDSPYNTYKNYGLPAGPIGNPGKAAIEAALNPENTDYYYYVLSAKLDGSHDFASTYEEFEELSKAYGDAVNKKDK